MQKVKVQNGDIFRIPIEKIKETYEFDNEDMFRDVNYCMALLSSVDAYEHQYLYFEKHERRCIEVYTRRSFRKVGNSVYFNFDTGMYFSIKDLDKVVTHTEPEDFGIDDSYINDIKWYFYDHEVLQKRDIELISKSHALMLKKNYKYTL